MNHPVRSGARPSLLSAALLALASLMSAGTALAQERYPSRPIELVVPWGPGGGADQLARKLGKLLEPALNTTIPVVNVPGATGNTGMTKMLAANPDGHTMAILIGDTLATTVGGGARWKLSDVVPVGIMMRQASGLFVKTDSKYKTFADLVNDAKARPNELKAAILGFGSADDMTLGYLGSKGVKLRAVPFASPGERYSSILGGHADVLYEQAGDIRSFLDGKQMRPLVFFADKRLPQFPDTPVASEFGFGIQLSQFRSIVVRAGTDPARIAKLAAAIEKAAQSHEFQEFLKDEIAFTDSFLGVKEAGAFLEREATLLEQNVPKKP